MKFAFHHKEPNIVYSRLVDDKHHNAFFLEWRHVPNSNPTQNSLAYVPLVHLYPSLPARLGGLGSQVWRNSNQMLFALMCLSQPPEEMQETLLYATQVTSFVVNVMHFICRTIDSPGELPINVRYSGMSRTYKSWQNSVSLHQLYSVTVDNSTILSILSWWDQWCQRSGNVHIYIMRNNDIPGICLTLR